MRETRYSATLMVISETRSQQELSVVERNAHVRLHKNENQTKLRKLGNIECSKWLLFHAQNAIAMLPIPIIC